MFGCIYILHAFTKTNFPLRLYTSMCTYAQPIQIGDGHICIMDMHYSEIILLDEVREGFTSCKNVFKLCTCFVCMHACMIMYHYTTAGIVNNVANAIFVSHWLHPLSIGLQ